MQVRIRLPAALRVQAGGHASMLISLPDGATATVGSVLDELTLLHPAVERRIRDERGVVRRHVNLFVGADNVRDLAGLDTPVGPEQELVVLPAVSGGAAADALERGSRAMGGNLPTSPSRSPAPGPSGGAR
ncbi:MAG: MoaD/ThiS family protein [Actinomycetota bacterium]|nr:MoaD/ThiS family protein [Actinomycetota bacterium]